MNLRKIFTRPRTPAMSSSEYWHLAHERPASDDGWKPLDERTERKLAETIGGDCVRCRRNLREHGSTMCMVCDG